MIRALVKKGILVKFGVGYKFQEDMPQTGIPIKGVITSGQIQKAIDTDLGSVTLQILFPEFEKLFAIRVTGQSITEVDVHDGDYILLVDEEILSGEIGAVFYNGKTSLKQVFVEKEGLRLEPINPNYNNLQIEPDIFKEAKILGRYIGHVNNSGIHRHKPTPLRRIGKPKIIRFHP